MLTVDKVLVVEDHEGVASVLEGVVRTAFDPRTIVSAATVSAGIESIKDISFDLALVDLGLPDGSGIEIIKALSSIKKTYIIVTTIFEDDDHLFDCLTMGAHGYLLKGHQEEEMIGFLQGILEGKPPLSPSIAQAILAHFRDSTAATEVISELTKRESEVLQLIAKGCHVKEVATLLSIANSTVSAHIKKIYQKLNIHNRAEATAAAVNLKLYDP